MSRLPTLAQAVKRYVTRAPGTHIYLLVLLVTTATVRSLNDELASQLLRQLSTNLYQMGRSAGRVLLLSAFLLDGGRWWLQAAILTVFFVPVERVFGTSRWLITVLVGHVGATLVTTVGIWADARYNRAALSLTRTIDVGASYGLFAAAGLLTFAVRRPWKFVYAAGLWGYLAFTLGTRHSFTDAGHFSAVCIGASMGLLFRTTASTVSGSSTDMEPPPLRRATTDRPPTAVKP